MDFIPVIFDISSDEEPVFDEPRGGDDDHDWLTGLLETVDRETADTDADDVVVVGEYVPPKSKSKSKPLKVVKYVDDDCVVLDGDPDKDANVADDAADDGDEVLVVGETGKVACRDYPHSRHLCAKFPFSSTPHEQHCNLCHCYVCDSLAPCPHWGTGISTIEHCHATDKQEIWKIQRQNFRLIKVPLPVSRYPEACLPITPSQLNQVPTLNKELAPNGRQIDVYRPTATNVFSARLNVPNIISQNRNRHNAVTLGRNRLGPCSFSQQALGIRGNTNTVLQSRGQQSVSRNTMFKRPGFVRSSLTKNQSVYGSPNTNFSPASQYVRNTFPVAATNHSNSTGWQNGLPNSVPGSIMNPSSAQPSVSSVVQPEPCSVPITHSNNDQNIFQLGNSSRNAVDSSFSDFEFWINSLDQSIQPTSVENIQPQTTPTNNNLAADNQFTSQLGGSAEHPKDNDIESWLLNPSEGLAAESCVPGDLNIFSPVPTAYDAGMLCFDFDTSWNGLAQV